LRFVSEKEPWLNQAGLYARTWLILSWLCF